jgi:hypothetical protein
MFGYQPMLDAIPNWPEKAEALITWESSLPLTTKFSLIPPKAERITKRPCFSGTSRWYSTRGSVSVLYTATPPTLPPAAEGAEAVRRTAPHSPPLPGVANGHGQTRVLRLEWKGLLRNARF